MPIRSLPTDASLENLRKQAKRLRDAVRAAEPDALARARQLHPRADAALAAFKLADAQLVLARAYGFDTWPQLVRHLGVVERFRWIPPAPGGDPSPDADSAPETDSSLKADASPDTFLRLACLDYGGWTPAQAERARRMLAASPTLAQASIYTAAAAGDAVAARALLATDRTLATRRGGPLRWEPLLYACYSRLDSDDPDLSTLEVARLLLAYGADPNAGFLWGGNVPPFTALTGAFGEGENGNNQPRHQHCDELARLLLEAGADPNDGQTLYNRHFNADDSHLELLLQYGLGRDSHGPWYRRLGHRLMRPAALLVEELWAAANKDYFARVKLLVEHGADVNGRGCRDDRTPYEAALRAGNREVAAYLLAHGARPRALDPLEAFASACAAGDRAAAQAMLADRPDLVAALGATRRSELVHQAVTTRRVDGVRLLAELGFDLSAPTSTTPLHQAAWRGDLPMVRLLVELGADPDAREPTYHATPLGWAAHNRQAATVDFLMQFAGIFDAVALGGVERVAALLRADPSLAQARDSDGRPLIARVRPGAPRAHEMLALLRAHGATLPADRPPAGDDAGAVPR